MPLFAKPLDQITQADLEVLIDNKVPEGKMIDYKRDLPGASDNDRKEFLADVSSFGNTSGGHLLFGVEEDAGFPVRLVGVEVPNPDALRLQFESMVRASIDPRLPLFHPHVVSLRSSGRSAVVIRIGRSWAGPHMVTFKGASRFYARHSGGKFQLDVQELRAAFVATEDLGRRMAAFRSERIAKIVSNDSFVPLVEGPKIIAHLLPQQSFTAGTTHTALSKQDLLPPGLSGACTALTPTFDGHARWAQLHDRDVCGAYILLFRSGCVETVDAIRMGARPGSQPVSIPAYQVEELLIKFVKDNLALLQSKGIDPPVFACFTLTGVKGSTLVAPPDEEHWGDSGLVLGLDVLPLPEVMFADLAVDVARQLRPSFDVLWNTFGRSRSMNYDGAGNRIRR